MKLKGLTIIHFVILLCLAVFALSIHSIVSQKDGLLKVNFFDVGQGESELITTPSGKQILIDGGPDSAMLLKLAKAMPFYDRSIDMVIATHPSKDYIGGLAEVLNRYDVTNIVEVKGLYNTPELTAWHDAVVSERANEIEATTGKDIDLGDGVTITIIYPDRFFDGVALDKFKEASVIMMLKYQSFRLLLTGSMDASLASYLVNGGVDIKADVLKISHSIYKKPFTDQFITAVSPGVAIVEASLPDPDMLASLESFGVKYYRTDVKGDVTLTSDGEKYQIKTEK